jgi:hypothetical protein
MGGNIPWQWDQSDCWILGHALELAIISKLQYTLFQLIQNMEQRKTNANSKQQGSMHYCCGHNGTVHPPSLILANLKLINKNLGANYSKYFLSSVLKAIWYLTSKNPAHKTTRINGS